jgi:hypothetical protein
MLILLLTLMGCSSVQGAEPVEVIADDWHGLEKRIMQLDCDGNLEDDTADAVAEK